MRVLLVGSGGREHAIARAIAGSPLLTALFLVPGNPGLDALGQRLDVDVRDHAALIAICRQNAIDFVVIGPEAPLVAGLVDDLEAAGIAAFGPTAAAAQLEGSKGFTKDLCARHGIPTAAFRRFSEAEAAIAYVHAQGAPIVVKADGLAAGKGVTVAATVDDAVAAITDCFSGSFGAAGAEVVVEACLVGEEASFFVLTDGVDILPLTTAQDHKRVGDGDTGPNTGGMGAYSPAPIMTPALIERTVREIIKPTVAAMRSAGTPFKGVLYAGLMLTADGPQLIEYNARFGDPETQVILPRLKTDLLTLLKASRDGTLAEHTAVFADDVALTVVMAAEGYPAAPRKGTIIEGIDEASAVEGVTICHAGTKRVDGALVADGGRVLNVTGMGATVAEAQARAYAAVDRIQWPGGFCRRDIGWRAL